MISATDRLVTLGYSAEMDTVTVQPSKESVGFDVICADSKAVLVEKIPSMRAAYCQLSAISDAISKHACEVKVLVV